MILCAQKILQMQMIIDEHKEKHRLTKEELSKARIIIIEKDDLIKKLQEENETALHQAAVNLQEERDKRRSEVNRLRDEHAASLLEVLFIFDFQTSIFLKIFLFHFKSQIFCL